MMFRRHLRAYLVTITVQLTDRVFATPIAGDLEVDSLDQSSTLNLNCISRLEWLGV